MEEKERFEILLEHMDKNIQTVLEGHLSLDSKIDRNHEEAKELNRKTNVKLDVIAQTLSGKIDKNREAIETNRKKIEQVDQKVEINREAIETTRQEIVRNREKIEKVDEKLSSSLEKYANHEDRIKVLEAIN